MRNAWNERNGILLLVYGHKHTQFLVALPYIQWKERKQIKINRNELRCLVVIRVCVSEFVRAPVDRRYSLYVNQCKQYTVTGYQERKKSYKPKRNKILVNAQSETLVLFTNTAQQTEPKHNCWFVALITSWFGFVSLWSITFF